MPNDFPNLIIHQTEDICWVQINRSEDRNSLNSELLIELTNHLEGMEKSGIRAIVYRGAGETYFIGGADGVEMHLFSPPEARAFSITIQNLFNRMEASPLIMVAAINGLCFGGGYEFALACDFRIASERARIGLPEVKVGIIPGGGGTQRLSRLVGMGKALQMILSGHLYRAEEALEMGLIHYLVEDDELERKAEEILRKIFAIPQHALSSAKKTVYASQYLPFDQGLKVETEEFGKCFTQDYFRKLIQEQLKDGRLRTTLKWK
jgi:enoyl-CoA hydratase/carnithine racemase